MEALDFDGVDVLKGKEAPKHGLEMREGLSGSVAPIRFPFFFGGCPTKMVQAPKRVPFFSQGH